MIFHSLDFLVFFLAVLAVYWAMGRRVQNLFLLVASYFFYGYIHHWFLLLIAASTVTDYFCGLGMHRYPGRKKLFLYASLVMNLGLLGFFKYFGFFVDNVRGLLQELGLSMLDGVAIGIVVPVGISFYTFQTLSYTIDIYRGELEPRRDFFDFALFVAFFPQLVAGPIERAGRLLPQLEKKRSFSLDTFGQGVQLAVWGFFKKLVIADNVGLMANKVFSVHDASFFLLWSGVFAFGIQIFADFSAYTDIARGVAKMLGIRLSPNFDHPYISSSPAEFWRRWHISFSNWLRDYLFLPIAYALSRRIKKTRAWGIKAETWAYAGGILGTMFLCGLWHGANWNFIFWGLYYALLILVYRGVNALLPRKLKKARWPVPFMALLMFLLTNLGWLIFREQNLSMLLRALSLDPFKTAPLDNRIASYFFFMTVIYSLPLWIHTLYVKLRRKYSITLLNNLWLRPAAAVACYGLMLFFRSPKTVNFIYFQF